MKKGFLLATAILFCQPVLAGTSANAVTKKATTVKANAICSGGYVTSLEVDQATDENDTGTITFTLSGGTSLTYTPAYKSDGSGDITYVPPGPFSWVTLLTASYVNQKPICYTTDTSTPPILTSVSLN